MNIDENKQDTQDNKVEEIAEALAEGVEEETSEVSSTENVEEMEEALRNTLENKETSEENTEVKSDEEETSTGETSEQQEPAEEVAETTTEEATAVEATSEENTTPEESDEKKKSHKGLIITLSVVAAVLLVLFGVYYGIAKHYSDCFFMRTKVNGMNCAGMTVDEVANILQKQVEEYVLTVEKSDGTTEQIKGTDIGIAYSGQEELEKAFKEQNPYKWPKALFKAKDIKTDVAYEFDSKKLEEKINALECLKPENQVAAVSATVIYQDGQFVIQDETNGTQIDSAKLAEVINAAVLAFEPKVNLQQTGCYLQPTFTKDSPEVLAARDEMNKYLSASITYSLDGIVVTLDKSQIYQWVSVDANMTPQISADGVKGFAGTLSGKYNTANRSGQLTTPTGKVVTMPLGGYGRVVGVDAETNQLINEIKEGKTVTREPIFSRKATPEGQNIWGNTYVEIDISAQHLWYISNGSVALETDVITGKAGVSDTPAGYFQVIEKIPGKYLRGRLVNGKPSYIVWVDRWMRLTWSGIGLHDCTWHAVFGGEIYKTKGSHGCVNIPPELANQLYGLVRVGTHVVIHY